MKTLEITVARDDTATVEDARVADLVDNGTIRCGVFPSFQYSRDATAESPQGLAISISRALASTLGLDRLEIIECANPVELIGAIKARQCDIGFLLVDPSRSSELDFSAPFVRSDFTYLVPQDLAVQSVAEIDRTGIRIAVVRGHASTAALERAVMHARLMYEDTFEAAVDLVRSGSADAFASIREVLLQFSDHIGGSRVLSDYFESNHAAIAVPKGETRRLEYIAEFLAHLKGSGLLANSIRHAGLRGLVVT